MHRNAQHVSRATWQNAIDVFYAYLECLAANGLVSLADLSASRHVQLGESSEQSCHEIVAQRSEGVDQWRAVQVQRTKYGHGVEAAQLCINRAVFFHLISE